MYNEDVATYIHSVQLVIFLFVSVVLVVVYFKQGAPSTDIICYSCRSRYAQKYFIDNKHIHLYTHIISCNTSYITVFLSASVLVPMMEVLVSRPIVYCLTSASSSSNVVLVCSLLDVQSVCFSLSVCILFLSYNV